MKKKVFALFIMVFALTLVASMEVNAWGSTFSTASDRDIGSVTYSYLSAGEINMFHYEVAYNGKGAYNIYTTGTTDTYGYLYERNGIWPFEHYDLVEADDDDGAGYNFRIEEDLDNYEDYYVKVRGYSTSTTGGYYLYFQKNLDSLYSTSGGEWNQNSQYSEWNVNIDKIRYYTADQISTYYLSMDTNVAYALQQAILQGGVDFALSALLELVPGLQGWPAVATGVALGSIIGQLLPDMFEVGRSEIFAACGGYWVYRNGYPFPMFTSGLKVEEISMHLPNGLPYFSIDHSNYSSYNLYGVELDRGTFIPYAIY